MDAADEADVETVHIPNYLYPNYTAFYFLFFPEQHLFVFQQYSNGTTISPNYVLTFLRTLASDSKIVEKFGEIYIDLISSREVIDSIFRMDTVKRLKVLIQTPNPDELDELEMEMERRLGLMNAKSYEVQLEATRGQSLAPDSEISKLAKVAARNGEVVTSGIDEKGILIEMSTSDHPLIESEKFDLSTQSEQSVFRNLAIQILRSISR